MATPKDIQSNKWETVRWDENNLLAGLDTLRERAESHAIDAINWYYEKKKSKNRWSRLLRFAAILFTILGGLVPIIAATGVVGLFSAKENTELAALRFNQCGYILIGLAAGCVALDRFFGFSTNWMRYIAAAMRVDSTRIRFRFEWERLVAPLRGKEPDDDQLRHLLDAIEGFSLSIREAIEQETGAWIAEFQTNLSQLDRETKELFEAARNEKKVMEEKAALRAASGSNS